MTCNGFDKRLIGYLGSENYYFGSQGGLINELEQR